MSTSRKPRCDKLLQISVPSTLIDALDAAAAECSLSRSSYARTVLAAHIHETGFLPNPRAARQHRRPQPSQFIRRPGEAAQAASE
jgi:hypothetical protein